MTNSAQWGQVGENCEVKFSKCHGNCLLYNKPILILPLGLKDTVWRILEKGKNGTFLAKKKGKKRAKKNNSREEEKTSALKF